MFMKFITIPVAFFITSNSMNKQSLSVRQYLLLFFAANTYAGGMYYILLDIGNVIPLAVCKYWQWNLMIITGILCHLNYGNPVKM